MVFLHCSTELTTLNTTFWCRHKNNKERGLSTKSSCDFVIAMHTPENQRVRKGSFSKSCLPFKKEEIQDQEIQSVRGLKKLTDSADWSESAGWIRSSTSDWLSCRMSPANRFAFCRAAGGRASPPRGSVGAPPAGCPVPGPGSPASRSRCSSAAPRACRTLFSIACPKI